MRKATLPMIAALLLCGGAATALHLDSARAQPGASPPASALPDLLAANDTPARGERLARSARADAAPAGRLCQELYAREAGRLAYLQARLALTGAQQPLFQRWQQVMLDNGKRRADSCTQRAPMARQAAMPSPVERMAQQETRLKQRLADLQAERPALTALYAALTPAQKAALQPEPGGPREGLREGLRGGLMRRAMLARASNMDHGGMDHNGMDHNGMEQGGRGPMGRPPGPGFDGPPPEGPPPSDR